MNTNGSVPPQSPNANLRYIIRRRAELVQRSLLFSEVSLEDRERIVALAREVHFKEGKTIFLAGDSVREVILLTSGCIKLSQFGPQGTEVILRLVGPGEALCIKCFPECTHCSTAQAVDPSSALVWEAGQFEAVRDRFPTLGRNVSCVLLQTLNHLEVRFRETSTEKVATRLSSQLVRLVNQVGKPFNGYVEIALSQRDLAQLTGTTLFTVSRLLGDWEDQGIVRTKREAVEVLDVPALMNLSRIE